MVTDAVSLTMVRITGCLVLLVVAIVVSSYPGERMKRGYNSGYGGGYDERDSSDSTEETSYECRGNNGHSNGNSRDQNQYNRYGSRSLLDDHRSGRAPVNAAASSNADATAYGRN